VPVQQCTLPLPYLT